MNNKIRDDGIYALINAVKDSLAVDIFEGRDSLNGMSRRQYYNRLRALKEAGLIQRVNGNRYGLTSAGIIMKKCIELMNKIIQNNYRLRALDVLKADPQLEGSLEELIPRLINDREIVELLATPLLMIQPQKSTISI